MAILLEGNTIVFCQYTYISVIYDVADDQDLACINGTRIDYMNLGSLYHNEKD